MWLWAAAVDSARSGPGSNHILAGSGRSDTTQGAVAAAPILVAWVLGALLAAGPTPADVAGNVYVQVQCGFPPEIVRTSHSVELSGEFSGDVASSRFLTPLGGQVRALRLDAVAMTLTAAEIQSGFIDTEELGRIFLTVSDATPGYRAILRDDQIETLERVGR